MTLLNLRLVHHCRMHQDMPLLSVKYLLILSGTLKIRNNTLKWRSHCMCERIDSSQLADVTSRYVCISRSSVRPFSRSHQETLEQKKFLYEHNFNLKVAANLLVTHDNLFFIMSGLSAETLASYKSSAVSPDTSVKTKTNTEQWMKNKPKN